MLINFFQVVSFAHFSERILSAGGGKPLVEIFPQGKKSLHPRTGLIKLG